MEQKAKVIILALAGILLIVFIALGANLNTVKNLERERNDLRAKAESMVQQLNDLMQVRQGLEAKVAALNQQADSFAQQKADLEKRVQLAEQAKNELVEQIKALKNKPAPAQQPQYAAPATDDAYWASILKAKTDLEFQIESVRTELKNVQVANEALQRDKSNLDLEVNNLNREKQDLQRQLAYNQKLMDSIAQELVRDKNDRLIMEQNVKPIKSENLMLRRQLDNLTARKMSLEHKIGDLEQKNRGLEDKLLSMDALLKNKMGDIDNLTKQLSEGLTNTMSGAAPVTRPAPSVEKASVELPPIVVRPSNERTAAPDVVTQMTGKVLAINRENNFVIVDLGESQGVGVGDQFQVFRDGKSLAKVQVIQVRKTIAACDIKKETSPIKVGDSIR